MRLSDVVEACLSASAFSRICQLVPRFSPAMSGCRMALEPALSASVAVPGAAECHSFGIVALFKKRAV